MVQNCYKIENSPIKNKYVLRRAKSYNFIYHTFTPSLTVSELRFSEEIASIYRFLRSAIRSRRKCACATRAPSVFINNVNRIEIRISFLTLSEKSIPDKVISYQWRLSLITSGSWLWGTTPSSGWCETVVEWVHSSSYLTITLEKKIPESHFSW